MTYRTCENCKKTFEIKKPSEANRPSRKCCSRSCATTLTNNNRYKDIGVTKACKYCKKDFFAKYSRDRKIKRYCNLKCSLLDRNKNILPKLISSLYSDKNSWNWKGDVAGYFSKHVWARKNITTPSTCSHCGKSKKLDMANISGKYIREKSDWIALCRSCHLRMDEVARRAWVTRKRNLLERTK